MDFGKVLVALKAGQSAAREGWGGRGMSIELEQGCASPTALSESEYLGGVHAGLFQTGDDGIVTRMPSVVLNAADGSRVVGWLASQTDMLADDWLIIDGDAK